ncbi:MAG: 50S ribosomal protein L19 [Parcubacteria group bacterium]|nr:50S ribosomal protein L19 [Parcubacteria group bacterium]
MDIIQEFAKTQTKRIFPDIKPGDTVRVHQKITEESNAKGKKDDKERIQVFEGLVLRVRGGKGINGSFLVRKTASGVGVEKNFPMHMPNLVKVEVVKRGRVRRARLYYLRDKKEKESRLQEVKLTEKELNNLKFDETIEEPKEEKKVKEDKKVEDKKATKSEDKDTKEEKPKDKSEKSQKKPENKEKGKDTKKEESKKEEKPKKDDKPKNKVKEENKDAKK